MNAARLVCVAVALATAAAPSATVTATPATAAPSTPAKIVPKGWASGGSDDRPQSQYTADIADMSRNGCGENTALLFRVRGSGSDPGGYPVKPGPNGDRLGEWLFGAGEELVRRGWRVRGLQAIYEEQRPGARAPSMPSGWSFFNPLAWKAFRDSATKAAPGVKKALVEAYERCPARSILIAGHSLGNIVLRIVLRDLPTPVLDKIRRVDLFSDPTADGAVDRSLQHPASLDGRLTNAGVDTAAARLAWKGAAFVFAGPVVANLVNFRQKRHPIPNRVYQYCVPYDLVCDVNPINIARATVDRNGQAKRHVSYKFEAIGRSAAQSLRSYASSPRSSQRSTVLTVLRLTDSWSRQAAGTPGCTASNPKFARLKWRKRRSDLSVRVCDARSWNGYYSGSRADQEP